MRRTSRSFQVLTIAFAVSVISAMTAASPAAAAKLKVKTTVQADGAGQRVVVALTSSRRPSSAKLPRSVTVKAAGRKIKLAKFKAAATAAGYRSDWRSKIYTGAFAARLAALHGSRVAVTIGARSGSSRFGSKVTVQTPPPPTPAGPLFPAPAAPLTGIDAFNHLSPWFLNSAFSDCAGVWPACAVEQRYVHCPSGAWEYHRNTPTVGADIHSYYSFTITGAGVNADGSWAVSYTTSTGGNYYWLVSNAGIATGNYQFESNYETLGPMYWSQPAITWQEPAGAC